MMSPRSFLVSRQNHFARPSPSTSPSTSPSPSSPLPSPRSSPRPSPRTSPGTSPSRSPPSSSVFASPSRKHDDLSSWDSYTTTYTYSSAPTQYQTQNQTQHQPQTALAAPPTASMNAVIAAADAVPRDDPFSTSSGSSSSTASRSSSSRLSLARDGLSAAAARLTPTRRPSVRSATSADVRMPLPSPSDEPRPVTPTSPVQIPIKASNHDTAHPPPHKTKYRAHRAAGYDAWTGYRPGQQTRGAWSSAASRRTSRDIHSPDAIPPSIAALLAVTSIPPPRPSLSLRRSRNDSSDHLSEKRMTVSSIIERAQEAEQEFSLSLSKSPLDVLLTAPEDLPDDDDDAAAATADDDDMSASDSTLDPTLSTRTVSLESMPSLSDSFATGTISSYDSPLTPGRTISRSSRSTRSSRSSLGSCHKARPTRRSMTPVSSPPGERTCDPLSAASLEGDDSDDNTDVDTLDFRVFRRSPPDPLAKTNEARFPLQPLKSAFKSNLTASLRALRNAARSLSNLNLTSIPPEDFLTRSILTLDPHIPYTDERRPPVLEEAPSAALRRYLNPTTGAHMDARPSSATAQVLSPALASASLAPFSPLSEVTSPTSAGAASPPRSAFTASIQMQTYRVRRPRRSSSGGSNGSGAASGGGSSAPSGRSSPPYLDDRPLPGPRQRELRENSDFIRIAVMEMAMRRVGKLDDRKPGRARLALPPRKMPVRPYVVGPDGVPARWASVTCSD